MEVVIVIHMVRRKTGKNVTELKCIPNSWFLSVTVSKVIVDCSVRIVHIHILEHKDITPVIHVRATDQSLLDCVILVSLVTESFVLIRFWFELFCFAIYASCGQRIPLFPFAKCNMWPWNTVIYLKKKTFISRCLMHRPENPVISLWIMHWPENTVISLCLMHRPENPVISHCLMHQPENTVISLCHMHIL